MAITETEIKQLQVETRFTRAEILSMVKHGSAKYGTTITHEEFDTICTKQSVISPKLRDRMWDLFDQDDNGSVSFMELVKTLSALLRGRLEDVVAIFFKLYDVNGDGVLSLEEVTSVYSDLIQINENDKEAFDADRLAAVQAFFAKELDTNSDGKCTMADFSASVRSGIGKKVAVQFWTPRNVWLAFITSFFELGTSLCLPAIGALSLRLKTRFECGATEMGYAAGFYWLGTTLGPLLGGYLLDRYGAIKTVILANTMVTIGALLQATCEGNGGLTQFYIARVIIGFWGLITPFTTLEVLAQLFPDHFMIMAGYRNLVQSASGFLAFIILPAVADSVDTEAALWFCVFAAFLSTGSNVLVYLLHMRCEECQMEAVLGTHIRSFATTITPKNPNKFADFILPFSFYLSTFGIWAQYFGVWSYTVFSVEIFQAKFGMQGGEAEFLSGFINLFGGLLGPGSGWFSDKYGQRPLTLAITNAFPIIAFILLATTSITPWIPCIMIGIAYGYGDTVGYPNIRILVGADRAGLGYGVAGVVGGPLMWSVPVIAGLLMDDESRGEGVAWFFAFLYVACVICWLLVRVVCGPKHPINLPEEDIVETEIEDIQAASLIKMIEGKIEGKAL